VVALKKGSKGPSTGVRSRCSAPTEQQAQQDAEDDASSTTTAQRDAGWSLFVLASL